MDSIKGVRTGFESDFSIFFETDLYSIYHDSFCSNRILQMDQARKEGKSSDYLLCSIRMLAGKQ